MSENIYDRIAKGTGVDRESVKKILIASQYMGTSTPLESMANKAICPEDILRIILDASKIPDGSRVTKVKGTKDYILRHELKVHHLEAPPLVITGFFIFDERGNVNQVFEDTELCWHITAEDLVDDLKTSWEPMQ